MPEIQRLRKIEKNSTRYHWIECVGSHISRSMSGVQELRMISGQTSATKLGLQSYSLKDLDLVNNLHKSPHNLQME